MGTNKTIYQSKANKYYREQPKNNKKKKKKKSKKRQENIVERALTISQEPQKARMIGEQIYPKAETRKDISRRLTFEV